jgi:hypothetical protein
MTSEHPILTDVTRARTSPVAGHVDLSSAPEPPQAPSYSPGMGLSSVGRPTPASTCCARLDRHLWWVRARGDKAARLGSIADREGILSLTGMASS